MLTKLLIVHISYLFRRDETISRPGFRVNLVAEVLNKEFGSESLVLQHLQLEIAIIAGSSLGAMDDKSNNVAIFPKKVTLTLLLRINIF